MGGAWGPEDLAGEAVLELDHLLVDDDLFGARRRPVGGGRRRPRIICEEEEGEEGQTDTPQRRGKVT